MNFPTKKDEIAYLTDLQNHYQAKSDELMKKEFFKKEEIYAYQTISQLAESAREVAELVRGGV